MLKLAEVAILNSFDGHIQGEIETIPAFKPEVLEWLEALADKLEPLVADEDRRSDIQQASYQAIVNAFVHGSKMSRVKNIHLTTEASDKQLTISIVDEGEGFDVEILTNPEKSAEYAFGGRQGIFMIRQAADEISFLPKGNGILMRFNLA